jgi:hypothetical protein
VKEELTSRTVVQDQIEFVGTLKGVVQFHNEGMIDDGQHTSFGPGAFHLSSFHQVRFAQDFHGKQLIAMIADALLH